MDNSPDPRSQAVYATKLVHLLDRFQELRQAFERKEFSLKGNED